MASGFDALPLSERARDAIHRLGWRVPTPIQEAALAPILAGHDLIGEAATGSGKTAVFGLLLAERIRGPGVTALVLVPTRELALQVTADLVALAGGGDLKPVAVYGGVPHAPQLAALADPTTTCIVATPGRLLEFAAMKRVKLADMRFCIVDEVDRLFDLGFITDVERILGDLPRGRQLAMFSATFPPRVAALARRYLPTARHAKPGGRVDLPESAEHFKLEVASSLKKDALLALLASEEPASCLIFAKKRDGADALARWLEKQGVACRALHGDLAQPAREAALAAFRAGEAKVLVATDVAARGLDVPVVTHVVNYDLPEGTDAYVHRAGRTARAGRKGRVVTMVTEQDRSLLGRVVENLGIRPKDLRIPGFEPPEADAGGSGRAVKGPPKMKPDKKRMKPGWIDRKRR